MRLSEYERGNDEELERVDDAGSAGSRNRIGKRLADLEGFGALLRDQV
jgi:hypothetical protein